MGLEVLQVEHPLLNPTSFGPISITYCARDERWAEGN
jgi:hypothetical protein